MSREKFRDRNDVNERRAEYEKVCKRAPTFVPCIIGPACDRIPVLDKEKFLLSPDLQVAQLQYVIRKRMSMDASQALFLYTDNRLATGSTTIRSLKDSSQKSDDGFLYITYALESAFGGGDAGRNLFL